MLYQKIPSGRFWIMPNDFFEKYKLNSRDFMVYCFLVSKKDKKGNTYDNGTYVIKILKNRIITKYKENK
mgnify:CR=1 FL=1